MLKTFTVCGAPEEILIDAKPHIGTDRLRGVLKALRGKLLSLGADILFESKATGLTVADGHVTAVETNDERIETDAVYLATGHSARDVYTWLDTLGVPMDAKPFAVGVRIEHPQPLIDTAQYGSSAGHPALPPADYKLNVRTPDGRGVYTFCMCPGGTVINASSEENHLNLNGMSRHARDGANANAALLVGVKPADFGGPLEGIALQRRIEEAAFAIGGVSRALPARGGFPFRQTIARLRHGAAQLSARRDPFRYLRHLPRFYCRQPALRASAARPAPAGLRPARRAAMRTGNALLLAGAYPA